MVGKILTVWVFLISVSTSTAFAQFDLSHRQYNLLLRKHVVESEDALSTKVKYKAMAGDKKILEEYLNGISQVPHDEYLGWDNNDQLAFLINAYNAFTIKLIIDNHKDINSIKDIGSFFSNPWKIKFFELFGKKINLDTIEHKMIRKFFSEPLIHGALVCAAKGCPPLRKEAYRGDILSFQLADNMQKFLKDRSKNSYDLKENSVAVSPIFKWYGKDFTDAYGRYKSVKEFIMDYAEFIADNENEVIKLGQGEFTVKYNDYDWSLNE